MDIDVMLICSHVCAAVYHDVEECRTQMGLHVRSNFQFPDINASQCVMFRYSPTRLIIAFRGTEWSELADIRNDLSIWTQRYKAGGKVHTGFSRATDEVFPALLKWLQNTLLPDDIVTVTGHSLGAAM